MQFSLKPDNLSFTLDPSCQLMGMDELKFIDLIRNTQRERALKIKKIHGG